METPAPPKQDLSAEFQDVYRREISYVVHTLRRLGVQSAELEDVAHDVFVAVYRHFGERDPDRPLKPWLFGFCFRIAFGPPQARASPARGSAARPRARGSRAAA